MLLRALSHAAGGRMKATITSTTEVVEIIDIKGNKALARAWEGVTEAGVPFTAYITQVQVRRNANTSVFEAELTEHKAPDAETLRAIGLRFVV